MTVDSPENYVQSMQPHVQNTAKATQADYETTEKLLNSHMQCWCNIMKFDQRVTHNYTAVNNAVPPLYGLRKDHKPTPDPNKGPPTRPVCGAVVASNHRASFFISSIIKPVLEMAPEACNSTEDFLSRIEDLNKNKDLKNAIIGSMDVDALYPSIDIEFSVDKCVELILESGIQFKELNTDELGLYLILTENPENLERNNLLQYCPTRKTNRGRKPTITAPRMSNSGTRWEIWNKNTAAISPDEKK